MALKIERPGVYAMTADEYHADPCPAPSLSSSIAHILLSRSPLHAFTAHPRLNPEYQREEKTAFDRGTAAHALLLEQDGARLVIVDAPDWKTKAAQALRDDARAAGKTPILRRQIVAIAEMEQVARVRLAQHQDPPIPFRDGRAEQALVWQEEGGVWCRARLDWLHDDHMTIDDYKSVDRLDPETWTRGSLYRLGHDVQAAFYMRGVKAVFGTEALCRFVVQENEPPYELIVVALNPMAMDMAHGKVERAIRDWRICLTTKSWPGYQPLTYWAEAPPWELARWEARQTAARWATSTQDDGRPLVDQLTEESA